MTRTAAGPMTLLSAAALSWIEHRRLLGPLPSTDPAALLAEVTASGLVGRGGAGFPTARKLSAVAAGRRAAVIANGAEGEPASGKDRHLLMTAPHLVLDGLQLAVRMTGARTAYLYAPEEVLAARIEPALRERRDSVVVRCVNAPDTFISGEESAAVAAVQGRRAVPTTTPPRVFESGVDGRPTLVQNVETLAHIALIARYGAAWFSAAGSAAEPGSRLMTISGAVRHPGVREVPAGSSLDHVLAHAGGINGPVSAVLVGGYHGGWVPYRTAGPQVIISRASLAGFDAAPGAGVIMALPAAACGLQAAADIVRYLSGQGARQCGPCRNGLPAVAATLYELAYRPAHPGLDRELERLSAMVANRGACHHPAGTVRLVRSTLRTFHDEVDHHRHGRCTLDQGRHR